MDLTDTRAIRDLQLVSEPGCISQKDLLFHPKIEDSVFSVQAYGRKHWVHDRKPVNFINRED